MILSDKFTNPTSLTSASFKIKPKPGQYGKERSYVDTENRLRRQVSNLPVRLLYRVQNVSMTHVNYQRNVIIIIPDELARVLSTLITFIEFVEHPYEFSLIARSYLDKLDSHR